jgi:hypothetical protein
MIHGRFGAPLAANFKARWITQIKENIAHEFRFFSLEFRHLFTPFRFLLKCFTHQGQRQPPGLTGSWLDLPPEFG